MAQSGSSSSVTAGLLGPAADRPKASCIEISERFEAHPSRMAERRRVNFGPQRRKNYVEMFPEAVSLAKSLHQQSLRDGVRTSLRELSVMLARQGHLNNAGNPYHPDEIRRMIKGPDPMRAKGTH